MDKYRAYETAEDDQLILRLRSGETDIVEYLMEKYKPLVKKRARTLYLAGGDQEDLLQEGMMGLFKAIREYEPERGASFVTFASLCIFRYMLSAIEASQRKKYQPLNSSISFGELEEGKAEMIASTEDNPENIMLDQERTNALMEKIRNTLSSYENSVLELYLDGKGYLQIAESLQKSPKSVDNALQRIRAKVQSIL